MVESALIRGVHVVCEKPLATSSTDAAALVELAQSNGLVATVPFVYRFHPMVRELRDRLANGSSRPALVSGVYLQDWLASRSNGNWRVNPAEAGPSRVFADIGSHWFDLVEFALGRRVIRVSARFSRQFDSRLDADGEPYPVVTEDSVTVQFELEGGVLGVFAGSQVAAGRKNRLFLEVSGDDQSFSFDQENPELLWRGAADGNQLLMRDPLTLSEDAARFATLPAGHAQGYADCFSAFVRDTYSAVRSEAPSGLPTFSDGLQSTRLVEAVVASAASAGAWIDCNEFFAAEGVTSHG